MPGIQRAASIGERNGLGFRHVGQGLGDRLWPRHTGRAIDRLP